MNWKKGFKRITHVVAIVIAVACGVIAVPLPIQWRNDLDKLQWYDADNWWHRIEFKYEMGPLEYLNLCAKERVAADYNKMSYSDVTQLIAEKGKLPDGKDPGIEVNKIIKRNLNDFSEKLAKQKNECFWYRLSTNELIVMVVLYGLGVVVAGYIGAWLILWYGGLAIFAFIHWLALGFREDKPANEKNNN